MVNRSKQKGTAFETDVVRYLSHHLEMPGIERRSLEGVLDRGDIAGVPNWVIECKNHNTQLWGPWMDETERERQNADAEFGLLVVKRRMVNVEKAFAVVPLGAMVDIMIDLGVGK